jgi:hypothetical protein
VARLKEEGHKNEAWGRSKKMGKYKSLRRILEGGGAGQRIILKKNLGRV